MFHFSSYRGSANILNQQINLFIGQLIFHCINKTLLLLCSLFQVELNYFSKYEKKKSSITHNYLIILFTVCFLVSYQQYKNRFINGKTICKCNFSVINVFIHPSIISMISPVKVQFLSLSSNLFRFWEKVLQAVLSLSFSYQRLKVNGLIRKALHCV